MIIPVLDVRDGIIVHAVAGRRSEYRPIVSRLTDSIEPTQVAEALLNATNSPVLYVADLDAIEHRLGGSVVADHLISALDRLKPKEKKRIWLDQGIRTMADHDPSIDSRIAFVIGTETIANDSVAIDMLTNLGPERTILSIDLIPGREQTYERLLSNWQQAGGRHVIWIDLAAVGTGRTVNRSLIQTAIQQNPQLLHYPGGGVRNRDDVDHWLRVGATGVLVASALHDGSIISTI